jgi:hypothetical protein
MRYFSFIRHFLYGNQWPPAVMDRLAYSSPENQTIEKIVNFAQIRFVHYCQSLQRFLLYNIIFQARLLSPHKHNSQTTLLSTK